MDYAHFVEGQRHDLYEFDCYGLDERMARDAKTIHHGKPPKPPKKTNGEPVKLTVVSKANGEG